MAPLLVFREVSTVSGQSLCSGRHLSPILDMQSQQSRKVTSQRMDTAHLCFLVEASPTSSSPPTPLSSQGRRSAPAWVAFLAGRSLVENDMYSWCILSSITARTAAKVVRVLRGVCHLFGLHGATGRPSPLTALEPTKGSMRTQAKGSGSNCSSHHAHVVFITLERRFGDSAVSLPTKPVLGQHIPVLGNIRLADGSHLALHAVALVEHRPP